MIPPKRILLVDDSPRDTEIALHALGLFRMSDEVGTVRDGQEALDYLYRRGRFTDRPAGNPAIVLLDVKMPRFNGTEVLRVMRGEPALAMIPVVMLTSSREEQDVVESYRLGANGYVVKPMNYHDYIEALKQLGTFWACLNEPPPGSLPRPR